jgi:hypothetical protein
MLCSLACQAKSTGVDEDSTLQSGPCYQALVDRNVTSPTTAPNRELGAACEAEHGDVEKAWARVLRLWGSDGVPLPDYDSYVPADAPVGGASLPKGVGLIVIVLVYAVFGTPMRSAARLMGMDRGSAAPNAAVESIASLVLRGLVALAVFWLCGIPYVTALCGILLLAFLLRGLTWGKARAAAAPDEQTERASAFSVFAADVINDIAGAAPGLLGLALLVQHDLVLLALALALAIVVSAPPVVVLRRRLRANPLVVAILSALLAAGIGAVALMDSAIAAAIGSAAAPNLFVPLLLAAAALGLGWRNWSASRAPREL